MSVRLLKKVLEEKEQVKLSDSELGDELESPDSTAPPSRNPFDLLNDDDDHDHDQEQYSETVDESLIKDNYPEEISAVSKGTVDGVSQSSHKSKKKKKKKNKDSSLLSIDEGGSLDVLLKTLSFEGKSPNSQPGSTKGKTSNVKRRVASILQVDPKFLNAENELRRIFGSKVVSSFENNNQTGGSRQMRQVRRGGHKPRKTNLVSPSDHWPRWDGSVSMEFLETRDECHYFRYVHSSSYSQTQRAFEAAKAIHDLDGIAKILMYNPYHLDSLITLAEYFKFIGEHQMSADAISKCLYALECAWHPMFTQLQGNCQLKFSHEANKPLFMALFIHMKNMDRRGCHRCALEVCKLLLSLDSDDPMGAMFCIDYFSLRAEQYTWLERFSEDYNSDNSLWLFPNFSYSLAICRFYLEQSDPCKDADTETAKATSVDLMKQALMLHPLVLKKLVAKVPLTDQVWTNTLKHAFFKADKTGSPSLDHLINIYVERSYILWRLPDLQKLLKDSAQLVIKSLDHNSSEARDWACVRKETFSSEKNEYDHLLVSDFSDSVPTMPPENLQNFMVDPGVRPVADPPVGDRIPRDIANRSPLAVLFESMLPWVDYGGREDEGAVAQNNQLNGHEGVDEDH